MSVRRVRPAHNVPEREQAPAPEAYAGRAAMRGT